MNLRREQCGKWIEETLHTDKNVATQIPANIPLRVEHVISSGPTFGVSLVAGNGSPAATAAPGSAATD